MARDTYNNVSTNILITIPTIRDCLFCKHAKYSSSHDVTIQSDKSRRDQTVDRSSHGSRDSNPLLVEMIFDKSDILKTKNPKSAKKNGANANVSVAEMKNEANANGECFVIR